MIVIVARLALLGILMYITKDNIPYTPEMPEKEKLFTGILIGAGIATLGMLIQDIINLFRQNDTDETEVSDDP